MLAKQLIFLAGADAAGVVLGARVPIILASRADFLRCTLNGPTHSTGPKAGAFLRERG